jgi:hypothetical protein
MTNTGTWNSDLAILFVVVFFLPIFLYMAMGVILRCREFSEETYVINVYEEAPTHKKETTKPKKEIDFRSIAINGLVDLGFSRAEARRRVAMLCSKNNYKKVEHLIVDAVRCV